VKPDANEKRIDPADGKAYTWEELRTFYSATYTKKAMESFWTDCKPAGKAKAKAKTKAKAKADAGHPPSIAQPSREAQAVKHRSGDAVEVLEEADFSEYGREKYNLSCAMLKVIYEIKPAASL